MKKMKLNEQYFIIKNLSDLLLAGFNIKQSLHFLKSLNNYSETINAMCLCLANGNTLSESVKPYFNKDIYNQIVISEKHGDIICCLKEISQFIELRLQQQRKIRDLLFYPLLLIAVLCGVIVLINKVILPQLGDMVTINHYDLSTMYKCLLFIGVLMLIIISYYFHCSPLQKRNLIAKMPLIGPIYRSYIGYFLSMQLKLMITNGRDFKDILVLLADLNSNTLLYALGEKLQMIAQNGGEFNELINEYAFIPIEFHNFFQQGNSIDNILKNLQAFSKIKFAELVRTTNHLTNLVQPLLFLIIGIVIITAYMGVLIPIYSSLKGI
jgi:competence protein ComGB